MNYTGNTTTSPYYGNNSARRSPNIGYKPFGQHYQSPIITRPMSPNPTRPMSPIPQSRRISPTTGGYISQNYSNYNRGISSSNTNGYIGRKNFRNSSGAISRGQKFSYQNNYQTPRSGITSPDPFKYSPLRR